VFAGRACRLNIQEAFWYLTGHAYWHQHSPPESYQPSVQMHREYKSIKPGERDHLEDLSVDGNVINIKINLYYYASCNGLDC
jgi:hypothetical protein